MTFFSLIIYINIFQMCFSANVLSNNSRNLEVYEEMRVWGSSTDTWHQIGVVKDTAFIWLARLSRWNSSVFPWSLIFLPAEMPNHWTMMFFRMRDHLVIDGPLLKELRSCCVKESNFLPREAGLKLMESASGEVTHWPNFTSLCQCVWNVNSFPFIFLSFTSNITWCICRITVEFLQNAETPEWKNCGAWPVSLATAPKLLFRLSTCSTDSLQLWR